MPESRNDKGVLGDIDIAPLDRGAVEELMTYKGYTGQVEFDADAGLFHGEVLDTRDIITFQGTSIEELAQAFQDSVDDYLEFCGKRGEEPDKRCSFTPVT